MSDLSGMTVEQLREMIREVLVDVLNNEPVGPGGDIGPIDPNEPVLVDKAGLLEVYNHVVTIADFLLELDNQLSWFDYKINSCHAYHIVAGLIDKGLEDGLLESPDWADVIERLYERADTLVDCEKPVDVGYISAGPQEINTVGGIFVNQIIAGGLDGLPIEQKIARIKFVFITLRKYGVISGQWVANIIADLDVLYRIYNPLQASPGGSTPYSHGGQ